MYHTYHAWPKWGISSSFPEESQFEYSESDVGLLVDWAEASLYLLMIAFTNNCSHYVREETIHERI